MTAHWPECSRAATGIPVDKFCDCDLIARVEARVRDEDVAAVRGLPAFYMSGYSAPKGRGQVVRQQAAIDAIDALRKEQ